MTQPLLVAIDGSAHERRRVLEAAASFAKQMGAPVKVLHIRELDAIGKGGVVWHEERDETIRIARDAAAELVEAGVVATAATATGGLGSIARIISDLARESDAAAIVVGTRGHAEITALLVGSMTHKLLHLNDRPPLVVP
jgi:nucleotide-binding universal stress UspA family protein